MAANKKSFLLYTDAYDVVKKMSNDQAGTLFKLILEYVSDLNPDIESHDLLIQIAFEPIKNQLKRDLKNWERYIEKQKENGKKGGRPSKEETQKTQAFFEKPKKADNVDVDVDVNVDDTVSNIEDDIIKEDSSIRKHPQFTDKNKPFLSQDHLSISWDEMNKLIDQFGEEKATDGVNRVLNYRKNSKYKSLYLTALKWLKEDEAKNSNKQQIKQPPRLAI